MSEDSCFTPSPARYRDRFQLPDDIVWCGSMVRAPDGLCHLFLSVWPRSAGFEAWVTRSRVAYAVAREPDGPYEYRGVVFGGGGAPSAWDRDVAHNPAVRFDRGRFHLYYTGNRGNGEYWDHRNRQRIGVATADRPEGPWRRSGRPVLDVSPGCWDDVLTSNPSVCRMPDGRYLMMYKAVGGRNPPPMLGPILHGVAFADAPEGPFRKHPEPILRVEGVNFPGEDPFVFASGGRLYAILKDNGSAFYRKSKRALVLFESADGIDWRPSERPLVATREIAWEDGQRQEMHRVERPQLYMEDGVPRRLFVAVRPTEAERDAYNLHFAVDFSPPRTGDIRTH